MCVSIMPGRTVLPDSRSTRAPVGTVIELAGPAAVILSPSMTTTASGTGALPVPSISVAPTRAVFSCAVAGTNSDKANKAATTNAELTRRESNDLQVIIDSPHECIAKTDGEYRMAGARARSVSGSPGGVLLGPAVPTRSGGVMQ